MGKPRIETEPAARPAVDSSNPGFDAGDPSKVADRNNKLKVRTAIEVEGLRFVMSTRQGRAWMRAHLTKQLFVRVGAVRPPGLFTGNSTTFYNAALRELGDLVMAELATVAPRELRLMEDEVNNDV